MSILDVIPIGGDQKPLVHIHDINIKSSIILLQALGVVGRLVASRETSTNLHTKLVCLLWAIGTNEGNACKYLPGDGGVILLE